MYRIKGFAFLLLVLCSAIASAQYTEIFGTVTDAFTKEPISYVNIRFHGSVRTAMTDPKGEYQLRTIEKIDSVTFSYVGFQSRTIAVRHGVSQKLNVELGSQELKLTEITVKSGKKKKHHVVDTTANYVYYRILENKDANKPGNVNSYTYESYDKILYSILRPGPKLMNFFLFKPFHFALENQDTTEAGDKFVPGVMQETLADVYYRKTPQAYKKIVKADKATGVNNPSALRLAKYQFDETNIYDNLFIIAYNSFVSPFSPNGIRTYYYYVTDTAKIDGRISYKFHFVGKVKEDLALKGYAWIDSATWAIKSVTFRPNEKANLNFIQDHTVSQEYTYANNKHWMLSKEVVHAVGSLLKRNGKTALLVTKLLERRNIQTDVDISDTLLKGPDKEILLDSARTRNKVYWDSSRFQKLTPQEQRVLEISDTIRKVRAWKAYEWAGRWFTAAFADAGPISFGKVLNFISKNNVEGWRARFGFETNMRFQHPGTPANNFLRKFYFTGYVAYGFKDKVIQYYGATRINLPRINDKWQQLSAYYRYDMRVPGQSDDPTQTALSFDNVVTLIGGKTLSKIMRTRELNIAYEKEWIRDFSTIQSMTEKTFYDIPGVFNFSRQKGEVIEHVPSFNVTEFIVDSRYSYHDLYFSRVFYRAFLPTKYPVFLFRYTAGVGDIQGDYFNYHNFLLTIKQRLSWPAGHTLYSFKAGKILGKVPYTAAYLTQGNLGYLLDKFNYNLLSEFEFVSDQYASLWVEHHFDGLILNKIPGLNRLRLREVIFVRSLIGSFDRKNASVLLVPTELSAPGPIPYVETGFGIENILYCIRVDFMWRATYRNKNGGQNWGVKFAFQPGF